MEKQIKEFEELLTQLLETNNFKRNEAEKIYTEFLQNNSIQCLEFLLKVLQESNSQQNRLLSAILFRQAISPTQIYWKNINRENQIQIQNQLLITFQIQPNNFLRKRVCDAISVLASTSYDSEKWDDLIQFIIKNVNDSNEQLQVDILYLIQQLSLQIPEMIKSIPNEIFEIFKQSFSEKNSLQIRFFATKAFNKYILILNKQKRESFTVFIPSILQLFFELTNQQKMDLIEEIIQELTDIVSILPQFYRQYYNSFCQIFFKISVSNEFPQDIYCSN
ncbi:importin-5-like [Anaeramoeba ignava]|uniref:Importin-5-like n=1 Tax=Anaeramoeba ignava TaxID=1746090 RepID=A0A9Q0LCX6_ANAIG|nr:importin-5-like [Anaeramoeba ignava]